MKNQIPPTKPLGSGDVMAAKEAHKLWSHYSQKIVDRSNYIIRKTAELFGGKIDWWDWSNGAGEVDGHFDIDWLNDDYISVAGDTKGGNCEWVAILKNEEWELRLTFLTRWIWEDFEQELTDGIKKYKEQKLHKIEMEKKKKIAREENKKKLKESAKSKLTKEERKALGI